jgi:DNA-binding winged helix-turn-helix (wHTH) protein
VTGKSAPRPPQAWRFGNAHLDERTLELRVDGQLVELERKPLQVLRALLRRAGDVLSHDELLQAVWPDRTPSPTVLKKCVSQLRDALNDADQSIVKTMHGYGYRLASPVEVESLQPSVLLSPGVRAGTNAPRRGVALRIDVAGTIELRASDPTADERVYALIDAIVKFAQSRGAAFIRSYGDDVLAVFESEGVGAATGVAIDAHRAAARAGFQLYSGVHAGDVAFATSAGHPDATGRAVDVATRLHKLTDGVPGHLFLSNDAATALSPEWRARAMPYGVRELKGFGALTVWTLDWQETASTAGTLFVEEDPTPDANAATLVLHHAGSSLRVEDPGRPFLVGRDKTCGLCVPDAEPRVSSKHVMIEKVGGHWILQDISRNGTYLRHERTGETLHLPYCVKTMIPRSGALCLGRPFADDPDGRYSVRFELT